MKRRVLALLLALAMIVPTMPVTVTATEGKSTIQLGADCLGIDSKVYYGNYKGEVLPWYVLNDNGFLLSEYLLGNTQFHQDWQKFRRYIDSPQKTLMNNFYNGTDTSLFAIGEQQAIADTTLSKETLYTDVDLEGQKVFPLCDTDIYSLKDRKDILRAKYINDKVGDCAFWWSRSYSNNEYAFGVNFEGDYGTNLMHESHGARPAMNLDLESVLFTSAADNTGHGVFGKTGSYAGNEWKLTLKDNKSFASGTSLAEGSVELEKGYTGQTLKFSHKALKDISEDYTNVTATLTNQEGKVLYYGSVNDSVTEQSTSFAIPDGLAVGSYTLSLYGEDWNGAYKTDYATGTPFTQSIVVTTAEIDFQTVTADGTDSQLTTKLNLSFSKDVPDLKVEDITVTGATKGTLTKLSGSGKYELSLQSIEVNHKDKVKVAVAESDCVFTPSEREVTVYKPENVALNEVTANGSDTQSSSVLTMTFDHDFENFNIDDITLIGASKGVLVKQSDMGVYKLTISDITVNDKEKVKVEINKDGYHFSKDEYEVTVRNYTWDIPHFGMNAPVCNDLIYMGQYAEGGNTYDVPWYLLNTNGKLLSQSVMGSSVFGDSGNEDYYEGSKLKEAMDELYNGSNSIFSTLEQGAVAEQEILLLVDSPIQNVKLIPSRLYPLSIREINILGLKEDILCAGSLSLAEEGNMAWWLSNCSDQTDMYYIAPEGDINMEGCDTSKGVRPVMNLEPKSICFTSAATGKSANGMDDKLTAVTAANSNEWKLTLLDSSRELAIATTSYNPETHNLSLAYTGATKRTESAPDEYISALVKDNSGRITYYGRLEQPTSADGILTMNLNDVNLNEGEHLYVFSEQYNGDRRTDYASELQEVSFAANAYTITNNLDGVKNQNSATFWRMNDANDYTTTLVADDGNTLPANITVKIGGNTLTAGTDYTYNSTTGTLTIPAAAITGNVEIRAGIHLSGSLEITGTLKYGETLTAVFSDDNNTGTLSYQWKRGNVNIGDNRATYILQETDIGQIISCEVTSSVEVGGVVANTASVIGKADSPAAPTGLQGTATHLTESSVTVVVPEKSLPIVEDAAKVTYSVKNKKGKKAYIVIKKGQTKVKGYQIQYASNKKFKGKKTILSKKTKITVKKLKKGKTYYFRVRAYQVKNKNKLYSNWSKIKKIRIKK